MLFKPFESRVLAASEAKVLLIISIEALWGWIDEISSMRLVTARAKPWATSYGWGAVPISEGELLCKWVAVSHRQVRPPGPLSMVWGGTPWRGCDG